MSERMYIVPEKYVNTEPLFERCGMTVREVGEWLAAHEYREWTCHMEPVRSGKHGKLAAEISDWRCDTCGAYVKSMVDDSMPYYCPCCGSKVVE